MSNSLLQAALAAALALAGLAWADAWWSHRTALRAQRVAAEAALLAALRQARDSVARTLEPLDRTMPMLLQRQAALQRGDAREALQLEQALAAAARRGEDGLRLVAVTDATGLLGWTSHPGALPPSLAQAGSLAPGFLAHRQGRGQPLLQRPRPGTSPALDLLQTRPLTAANGAFAGMAVLGLEAGRLLRGLPAPGPEAPQLAFYQLDGTPLGLYRNRGDEAPMRPTLLLQVLGAQERLLPPGEGGALLAGGQPAGLDLLVVASFATLPGEAARRQQAWHDIARAALVTLLLPTPLALLWWRRRRRRSANPLEVVITRLPVVAYVARFDEEGFLAVHSVAPGFQALCGWPAERFRDQARWQALIDLPDLGQPTLAERLRQGGTVSRDYRLRRPDGGSLWLRDSLRQAGEDRRGAVLLGCLQDVTREHQLAEQAATAARLMAESSLAASLAHELQQPLAIMALSAENALAALAEGPAALPQVGARLHRIQAQSQRAQAVAAQLRSLARLDASSLQPVDLATTLAAALAAAQPALQLAGVQVALLLPLGLPAVQAEPLLLEQVLLNLLQNAADALQASAPGRRRLRLSAAAHAEEVVLRLADTGPGIAPDALERVFDPFFTTKAAGKGSGLGLPLCRTVMQRFGGGIELRNHAEGAEAVLRLRRIAVQPRPLVRQPQPAEIPGQAGG